MEIRKERTELCDLAWKYASDKALFYTPYYYFLFDEYRRDVKKVLELGIGYPGTPDDQCMLASISRMGLKEYKPGASLFMWRDYFPNAEIFALDYKPEIFINEDRIHSFYVDQTDESSYAEAIKNVGTDFDIVIEDGLHEQSAQLLAAKMLMPILNKDGVYIMEDANTPTDYIEEIPYPCMVKEFGDARIVVIRHKY